MSGEKNAFEGIGFGYRPRAPYASDPARSRGRFYPELESQTRTPFQRDRDRIIHSTAFRRLKHKTQVFVAHEGDHYRTRLTHSIEVAQVARALARALRADEDLAEAVALVHDFGHTPFGHTGEDTLAECMKAFGGFDHNSQALRVVTKLERRYAEFDGLNLTWETLEGLAKHNGPLTNEKGTAVLKVTRPLEAWRSLEPEKWASAEAQVAALSDDIAYLTHDVDDGLRAGLLSLESLENVAFVGPIAAAVLAEGQIADKSRDVFEVTRRMITALIRDVVVESRRQLAHLSPESPDDIRAAGRAVIRFSAPMWSDLAALRSFLFDRVYRHPRVTRVMTAAEGIVRDLFTCYADPNHRTALPEAWQDISERLDTRRRARLAADYLAGQTDRYAIAEHRRLFAETPELR